MVVGIILNEKNNIFFFAFTNVNAASISDYETENLISDFIFLIQENNQTNESIKFSIVLDENPNAFINESRILYITTGLIKYIPSYEALVGVLAHELGHIVNYHITKRIDSINSLKTLNKFSYLSFITASVLSKNADLLLQSMVTNQLGIQNYYSAFSRDQEREADIYAAETLNKLHISPKPLKDFLRILEKNSFKKGISDEDLKFSSHPVYKERFEIIDNVSLKKKYSFDPILSSRFKFVKAKLFGFTENNSDKLNGYLKEDYLNYANSIFISRNGQLKESLIIINKLINKYPKNIFIMETKADLLLTHGYSNEAKKFYEKVLNKNIENVYVKKRIFEIKYEEINKKDYKINQKFFSDFSDLIFQFNNDIMLQKKFLKVAILLEKNDWINFIDANILLKNGLKQEAQKKLNEILNKSKEKKLLKITKQKIRLISNE